MKKYVNDAGAVIEATDKMFNLIYQQQGFTPYKEGKKGKGKSKESEPDIEQNEEEQQEDAE